MTAPLTHAVITAVARLVDDAQKETREPSHSDIEFQIQRSKLTMGDPKAQGQLVGKAKRVRGTLNWAQDNNEAAGELLVKNILALVRGCGGFRPTSPNYVGSEAIQNAVDVFKAEGFVLTIDGELSPLVLENLSGQALSEALSFYVKRAKRGADDAALLTGTGKDLLEATVAHILVERFGSYSNSVNFESLLGQAYVALDMSTPKHPVQAGEIPQKKIERAMFELACSINSLRNKTGTGHGRPWLPNVTDSEARCAIQFMGTTAEWLLQAHALKRRV